jgi:hypothetical protein
MDSCHRHKDITPLKVGTMKTGCRIIPQSSGSGLAYFNPFQKIDARTKSPEVTSFHNDARMIGANAQVNNTNAD